MSYKSVVVLGGGPIGLMCAIEAMQIFSKRVTIVEKRMSYSRTNVPQLQSPIVHHLESLGVSDKLWSGRELGSPVPFAQIEEVLWSKAESMGVTMLRGFIVESVTGQQKKKDGFYKSMLLSLKEWDSEEKISVRYGKAIMLPCDLMVIASGGGASGDPILKTLGFSYDKLKAKNYGAFGIFTPIVSYHEPEGPRFDQDKAIEVAPITSHIVSGKQGFTTPDHNYLLVTLAHCTRTDFNLLQQNAEKLKEVLISVAKTYGLVVLTDIKDVEKNMAIFKVAIQRVKQFFSPEYPAIIVGDAAVTPHPETGSGIGTGFKGVEEVQKLFQALKSTHRSEDPRVPFMSFAASYELHVSQKALEGTRTVLRNLKVLLQTFKGDIRALAQGARFLVMRDIAAHMEGIADRLIGDIDRQDHMARGFIAHLEGRNGNLDWDATVGALWRDIDRTYAMIKRQTGDISLLTDRLEELESKIQFS
jgi:2-polyprenyl-6-methoxyphenol hydroxylase-like FAD-dependent oxidoreductase